MKKSELLVLVSKDVGVDKETVKAVYDSIVKNIRKKLSMGINVNLHGFMTFTIVVKGERTIHNPQNGEMIHVPKRYGIKMELPRKFREKIASKTIY